MIQSTSMYAASAFPNGGMTSEFLIEMDNAEKAIIEKEDKEIIETTEKEKQNFGLIMAIGNGIFSLFMFSIGRKPDPTLYETFKDVVLPSVGFSLGSYGVGRAIASTIIHGEKIYLNRSIRLQNKCLSIDMKMALIAKESLDLFEIKQLQEAKIFFNAHAMDYQNSRFNEGGRGTSILYQNNVYKV